MSNWRSGRVKMSGTVAERLFDLLPPLMPLADKYRLTEQLWNHFGPSSKKLMRVGPEVRAEDVAAAFADHINSVIGGFAIPSELERRFSWLAAGDVAVKQQLLGQLVTMERSLVAEGVRLQFPVMLDHLARDTDRTTTRLAQIVKVRKHELEILIDRDAEGIAIEDPPKPQYPSTQSASTGSGGWGCLIIMGLAALVLFLLTQR